MFGFLKDKLKSALGKLTKEVEKDSVVEKKEVLVEKKDSNNAKNIASSEAKDSEPQKLDESKKRGFFQRIFGKKEEEDIIEDKEVLRERAEKTILEVQHKKEKDVVKETPKEEKRIEKKIEKIDIKEKDIVNEIPKE